MTAQLAQFPGFVIDEDEADLVAKPAARILARHPEWAETVRTVSDPLALVGAIAAITIPRYLAYKAYAIALAQARVADERAARGGGPVYRGEYEGPGTFSGENAPARERTATTNGMRPANVDDLKDRLANEE
jgi:hypothetical protein